jgi:hypothetical protein
MSDEIFIPEAREHARWNDAVALAEQFPTIPNAEIAAIVMEAHRGVELFGLTREEERQMAQRIATALLRQRTGEDINIVRLDPETHVRQRRS